MAPMRRKCRTPALSSVDSCFEKSTRSSIFQPFTEFQFMTPKPTLAAGNIKHCDFGLRSVVTFTTDFQRTLLVVPFIKTAIQVYKCHCASQSSLSFQDKLILAAHAIHWRIAVIPFAEPIPKSSSPQSPPLPTPSTPHTSNNANRWCI